MQELLEHLFEHNTLSSRESEEALRGIASGKYSDIQVTAFLTVFRMRGITVDELSGFRSALLSLCHEVDLECEDIIDLCGTGGDGKDTFNISTLSSFILAGAGIKVVKHGNYGVSSPCGSSNILEYHGYKFLSDKDSLQRQLDTANICFLHAPLFHPAMKAVAQVRRNLKVRTFFNMLGPMVNPARPKRQLIGVNSLELQRFYKYVYAESPVEYRIIHSIDGYDEISLTGSAKVVAPDNEYMITPADFGFDILEPEYLSGGNSIKTSAKIFTDILDNNGTEAQRSVVIANSALAIQCANPKLSLDDAVGLAGESLDSGSALKAFQNLLAA